MAMTYGNTGNLRRSQLWTAELKEILQDELMGQGWVRWLTDFPDGDTLNIPSIGEATVRTYTENNPVVYDALDTGNFTFTITEYVQSGTYITEKARQDAFYAAELEGSFVPKQSRAIAEYVETKLFAHGLGTSYGGITGDQTGADDNDINGVSHRFVAGAQDSTTNLPVLANFAQALYSLKKANVPDTNLIAIVDPSWEYVFNTLSNVVIPSSVTPVWGDLLTSGIGAGPRFIRNIYGFDVYVSNYLGSPTGSEAITSTFASAVSKLATSSYKANLFFSAWDQRNLPLVGAWRQQPKVDSEYNKDLQREEYVTTCRFGHKLYRPENFVVVLSNPTV